MVRYLSTKSEEEGVTIVWGDCSKSLCKLWWERRSYVQKNHGHGK